MHLSADNTPVPALPLSFSFANHMHMMRRHLAKRVAHLHELTQRYVGFLGLYIVSLSVYFPSAWRSLTMSALESNSNHNNNNNNTNNTHNTMRLRTSSSTHSLLAPILDDTVEHEQQQHYEEPEHDHDHDELILEVANIVGDENGNVKFPFVSQAVLEELRRSIDQAKKLYLNEKYLRVLKLVDIHVDSKHIVDRSTKRPLDQVLDALNGLDESDAEQIVAFVREYLSEPGVEISAASFVDWTETPAYVHSLHSSKLRAFCIDLNKMWLDLYKQYNYNELVNHNGLISSHLPMKHPFLVPGGRFIEMYYWDSFWILEGLCVSGMYHTARQLIENHMYLIEQFGFMPNGSRVYYLNRSQPPYLTQMCMAFYEFVSASDQLDAAAKHAYQRFILDEALGCLVKEYMFWMRERSVLVDVQRQFKHKPASVKLQALKLQQKRAHRLNVYKVDTNMPRPESYFEDLHMARDLKSSEEKARLYRNIASAAESGHDFSSRWFDDPMRMETIQTTDLLPVDLNSVMYRTEVTLAKLFELKKNERMSKRFQRAAVCRKFLINTLLWSDKHNYWADYNMRTHTLNERHFYLANLAPLLNNIKPPTFRVKDYVEKVIKQEIMDQRSEHVTCGIPFSFVSSPQQWDAANVWPPNQHELIIMLLKYDRALALELARNFFRTVYRGWLATGHIFEKYNSAAPGERGGQGEYIVQIGFGWTNGVILRLISLFKDELINECECDLLAAAAITAKAAAAITTIIN